MKELETGLEYLIWLRLRKMCIENEMEMVERSRVRASVCVWGRRNVRKG